MISQQLKAGLPLAELVVVRVLFNVAVRRHSNLVLSVLLAIKYKGFFFLHVSQVRYRLLNQESRCHYE